MTDFMRQTAALAFDCPPTDKAYSVGALIVKDGQVVATGYSRERGDIHAEEIAIEKARAAGIDLTSSTIYSTLEPCSVRKSGKTPCCAHIIAAGIATVVFALHEPTIFVECEGEETLRAAGIDVIVDDRVRADVLKVNPLLRS